MIASFRRRAAGDSDELRFRPAVDHAPRSRVGPHRPRERRRHARFNELLANSHDLPIAQPDFFGDLPIGISAVGMRRVGQKENLGAANFPYTSGRLSYQGLQFNSDLG